MTSVKIAAKPCKHGTLPDDRLRLFCKTAKPTAVGDSLKSPALRGFVGGLRALATAALYLVIFSNGVSLYVGVHCVSGVDELLNFRKLVLYLCGFRLI